jgi:hypothetical protein
MKLAIMQPYFFSYLGYYQVISAVDKYILYDNLAYIKGGWVNRNRVLVVNGEPVFIIVPVKHRSSFRKISEVELADQKPWRRKMLNSIFLNYKRSQFFQEVYPLVERVIRSEVRLLSELNARSVIEASRYLDIQTEIITDISSYLDLEEKLANDELALAARFPSVTLQNPEKKVIRVIEICHAEGADTFINTIAGGELYDKEEFARHNIQLFFHQTDAYSYQQTTETFHPHLSIIDVLMNCGKERTKELLKQYVLI